MAVGGRFIHSNLKVASDNGDASPASTFAVDIAGYYQSEEIAYSDFNGRWRGGFNFQNAWSTGFIAGKHAGASGLHS